MKNLNQYEIAEMLILQEISEGEIEHPMRDVIIAVANEIKNTFKKSGNFSRANALFAELEQWRRDDGEIKSLHTWYRDDDIEADMEDGFERCGVSLLDHRGVDQNRFRNRSRLQVMWSGVEQEYLKELLLS